jgi:hypothetical protein
MSNQSRPVLKKSFRLSSSEFRELRSRVSEMLDEEKRCSANSWKPGDDSVDEEEGTDSRRYVEAWHRHHNRNTAQQEGPENRGPPAHIHFHTGRTRRFSKMPDTS